MTFKNDALLLLKNGYVIFPETVAARDDAADEGALGTVLANMSYYGFAPALDLLTAMMKLSKVELGSFWGKLDPMLAEITGDNRNMDDFVVYKNFPKEVLEMSQGRYWFNQILMYLGAPNAFFTQGAKDRDPLNEALRLKVLDIAGEDAFDRLCNKLIASGASWQPDQIEAMAEILKRAEAPCLDLGKFGFRANGVLAATMALAEGVNVSISTTSATDILRIAAGISGADVELKATPKFRKFSRPERRMFVEMLETCADLEADFARRSEIWKRFLSRLHPGDYKCERVSKAYADLYAGSKNRLSARLEKGFIAKDPAVLDLLANEPGTFMRELHRCYGLFGKPAFDRFKTVIDELTVEQLLKISSYLQDQAHDGAGKSTLLVRPRGNWAKTQVVEKAKPAINPIDLQDILQHISGVVGARVNAIYPQGVDLDLRLTDVTLATNGQELASYGRGTEFDIPENATFVRTASYWAHAGYGNTWFDNGWNFFDENWQPVDTCCWDSNRCQIGSEPYAIFSGDPTNSKDLKGRGCQMIDIYLDEMEKAGITYAVWNILCYSHVPFEDAKEVLGTLQWGEEPMSGKLYEPARAQMVFPLKGKELTKFVAYIDVARRKLVYMDAAFPGLVRSAHGNEAILAKYMPAFQAYTRKLPTIADLFACATPGSMPIVKNDEGRKIDGKAFVFERLNAANKVEQIDLEALLRLKAADVDRALNERQAPS